jgi:hypothetical protein
MQSGLCGQQPGGARVPAEPVGSTAQITVCLLGPTAMCQHGCPSRVFLQEIASVGRVTAAQPGVGTCCGAHRLTPRKDQQISELGSPEKLLPSFGASTLVA